MDDDLSRIEKTIRNFKLVVNGTDQVQGGFGNLPRANSTDERIANVLKSFNEFQIVGGGGVNVEGSIHKGFCITVDKRTICGEATITPILPTGACCLNDGSCIITNSSTCASLGGTYQGDNTLCSPNPCPQPDLGACCRYGGECGAIAGCTDGETQIECEADGGTWLQGQTCSEATCTCQSQFAPHHMDATLTLTGSATYDCDGIQILTSWNCSYFASTDFDPCNPSGVGLGGSDPCTTCSGSCTPSTSSSSVGMSITPSITGLLFGTPSAFLICSCGGIDGGYSTAVHPKPTFSQSWCGWPASIGTYNLSDTVSWSHDCTSSLGSGSATWSLIITLSL